MSCQENSNRGFRAATTAGISKMAGKTAYAAGLIVGTAGGAVVGGVLGSALGPLGTIGGSSIGAVAGMKLADAAEVRASGHRQASPANQEQGAGNQRYGGGFKTKAAVVGAGALGGAAGLYSGATLGAMAAGPVGAALGAPLVGLSAARYWGKLAGQQMRVKQWLKSEAGQTAMAERKQDLQAAKEQYRQSSRKIKDRIRLGRQVVKIQEDFEQRAIRESAGG